LNNQYKKRGRMKTSQWMDAGDAAALLRVSRATLYAYVSRGYVRSQKASRSSRERRYSREDIDRLRLRTEERRDPAKAAARALHWGVPILESSIALIDGERLYYRGHDAVTLARSRSVADIASLIWTGGFDALPTSTLAKASHRADRDLPFVARAQAALARASAQDPLAYDLRPASVALVGWRIVGVLTHATTVSSDAETTIDGTLARTWHTGTAGADLLRSALILCADHELNVSSFTARCVASAGSNPYAVVIAGLAALEGIKHGGASRRVEFMLESMRRTRSLNAAMAERLQRGDALEGFGHPLYRTGDPRAAAILELLRERYPRSQERAFIEDVADAARSAIREYPNLDFALAALTRVMRLPAGSGLVLFAVGRSIGWIGHAIEQYATGQLIRPRAKYVGSMPAAPQP
jgi:citrate synthase